MRMYGCVGMKQSFFKIDIVMFIFSLSMSLLFVLYIILYEYKRYYTYSINTQTWPRCV